ncbi:transcription factor IIA subunit alpha [Coemansia biformis]|uniref:Transcription factor IIA subunit alpha n=1 Tax=Coemansia biformis TaxID=1286918 RepID=A0A9W7XSC5_9FUNG|nr:transcription factor IIA subunit alpha [Coemansia biformis]
MSNSIVAAIYRYVIDDVVHNVQADFEGHGVDTSVLEELQRTWEARIVQSRVASFPDDDVAAIGAYGQPAPFHQNGADGPDAGGYAPYHYPHHPHHAHHQHQHQHPHQYPGAAEAAANVNSAASLASIINNPESMAPSAASLASLAQSGRGQLLDDDDDSGTGSGHHYGGSSANIPQNDGAADAPPVQPAAHGASAMEQWRALRDERRRTYQLDAARAATVPQVDGASDDEDDDEDDEGEDRGSRDPAAGPSSRGSAGAGAGASIEAPEDAINSDLDDSDEEEDNEDGEDTEHVILCQYDKVTRSKNKWKCVLRDGIMLINGRDYLFQKANGDFEW